MNEHGEWEVAEKIPRYNDIDEFEVWVRGEVRRARRVGNRSTYWTPGLLIFTDCTNPMQNAICDEESVQGWRIPSPEAR